MICKGEDMDVIIVRTFDLGFGEKNGLKFTHIGYVCECAS